MICPVDHERVKRDSAAWALLPYVGEMKLDADEPTLELRNCAKCNSTLARERKP